MSDNDINELWGQGSFGHLRARRRSLQAQIAGLQHELETIERDLPLSEIRAMLGTQVETPSAQTDPIITQDSIIRDLGANAAKSDFRSTDKIASDVFNQAFQAMAGKEGKPQVSTGVLEFWPRALRQLAVLSEKGWSHAPGRHAGTHRQVPTQYFIDARARHLLDELTEGPLDLKLNELHCCCIAWNSLEILERALRPAGPDSNAGYCVGQ